MNKWKSKKHVLVVRPDNLGDVLMSSPAMRALKESNPSMKMTLLTSQAGAQAATLLPFIDDVLVFNLPWARHTRASEKNIQIITQEIKNREVDGAIIFTVCSQNPQPSALLCYQAGICDIAAYSRETPYDLINYWLPDHEPLYGIKHQVIRDLDLIKYLGISTKNQRIEVSIPEKAKTRIKKWLRVKFTNLKPFMIIHPGVSEERRQYPPELMAQAGKILSEQNDLYVLVTGTQNENTFKKTVQEIIGQRAVITPDFMIEELAALISLSKLLIANNTGPVHIAAGTQTPVVVLYAQTNPQHLPWMTPYQALYFDIPTENRSANVLLQYMYEKYLTHVDFPQPKDIVEAAESLLHTEIT